MKQVYKLYLLFFVIFIITLTYSYSTSYHWQSSVDGNTYLWTQEYIPFTWDGLVKGKFAHGKGSVQFYENGKATKKETFDLIYGAEEKHFSNLGDTTIKYAGDFSTNGTIRTPNGIGVFITAKGHVYAGSVVHGQLATAYYFVSDKLQYHGDFVNNKYSGHGDYYINNILVYSGQWKDGKQSGNGIEYSDNAEFHGNYENGKRNGLFKIFRNGTTRFVSFANGIPDLENCKIYYNDGTIWTGGLNASYEPSGRGTIQDPNGFVRIENRSNGELTGSQKISFPDGSFYEGEVINGKRSGYGIQLYSDGITYTGNWENDFQSGYGELIIDDDWYYVGEWKNGIYEGTGTFCFSDFFYEGNWKDGKENGYGTLVLSNLSYEGTWLNGELNGEGCLSYQDGSYYEGSWKHNKRNGYGEYVWADGSSYYGNWEDDFPNGQGEINLSNGDYYSGELEYGYFSGAGIYLFANGDRYEGTFVENKKSGVGLYYFENGNSYEGEFKENQPNGNGRFYFSNGIFYEGNFENGKLKGEGALYIPEGDDYTIITSSIWSENILPTSGSVLFANGDEFVGTLENGMPTNYGTWTTREDRLNNYLTAAKLHENGLSTEYETWTIREDRQNNRSTATKLREFYGRHKQTIEKVFSTAEKIITDINIAATIAEFIPFPPVQAVALVVDKACDVASCVISGTNIAIKTAVLNYDIGELKQNGGTNEEISALKCQYAKDISGDALNIAVTIGLKSVQAIRAGSKAKKATETYSKLAQISKTAKDTGKLTKIAKSGKFKDKLVREIVSTAYGKAGQELVKQYGDDAAKLLFKHGDKALYALTDAGETLFKVAEKGGEKALKAVLDNGEDAIKILGKNLDNLDAVTELIAKKGKAGIKFLQAADTAAPHIAKSFIKYGDDYFEIIQKLGVEKVEKLTQLIRTYGDDVSTALLKVQKQNPKNLSKAIRYIDAKGIDGLRDIKKWNGKIPSHITNATIRLAKKRYKSSTKASVDAMLKLPTLKLSTKELDSIRMNPVYLPELVRQYTGKPFKEGYKEFFIRMSKQNKNQIEEIWNYNSDIRKIIKGVIRTGGGKHEWLMCENFVSFLTDPKWGKDGTYLAGIIDQLATDTFSVVMNNGWTHAMEACETFGSIRNPKSVIHNGIRQIIKESNNADELLLNLKKWISANFTRETFDAFEEVLILCAN